MSKNLEERVVKAVFDNSEFEKYANQTIETLGRFETVIGKVATGADLGKLGQSVVGSMKMIADQIDKTGKKYSWLEQIAVGAYRKIGESVLNYGKNEIMKITGISEATSGWKKYESEVESVQSIMNATGLGIEKVEEQLEKLSWYTDETSFHYGDMVSNIAKFNAAGVKDLGKATDSMIGIANMAGYFGVNATKATHAMEGFAKAMGKGYMDNDSWQWIQTAGMNAMDVQKAFVDTAVELGKIKKVGKNLFSVKKGGKERQFTYEQFKNELASGWLDKKVMNATFAKYSKSVDAIYKAWQDSGGIETTKSIIDKMGDSLDKTSIRALKASQETKTFTDAVGALEEVVASGWRTTWKYIFGNYEEARDMWSAVIDEVWDLFAGAGYARNDLLKEWYDNDGRTVMLEGIANMWYGLKAIVTPIKDAFDAVFPATTVEKLLNLTEKFKNFSEKFRSWFDFDFFKEKNNPLSKSLKTTKETTETFEDACKRTRKELDRLYNEVNAGKWGTMWDRWKALGEAGYVWQIVQNEVNKRYNEALGENRYGQHKVVDDGTVKLGTKMVEVTEDIAGNYNIISKEALAVYQRAWRLESTMKGLFSLIAIVKDVVKQGGKFFGKLGTNLISKLTPAFDSILEKTSKWGKSISNVYEQWKKNDTIAKFFDNLATNVSNWIANLINVGVPAIIGALEWITKKIQRIADGLWPIVGGAFKVIIGFLTQAPAYIKKAYQKAKPFFDELKKSVAPTIDSIKKWIEGTAWPFLNALPGQVLPFLSSAYESSKKFVTGVWGSIVNGEGFKKLRKAVTSIWQFLKSFAKSLLETFKKYGGELYEGTKSFFDSFKSDEGTIDWGSLLGSGLDWAAGKISEFIDSISKALGQVQEFYQQLNPGGKQNPIEGMAASVSDATEGLNNFAENKLEPLKKFFMDVFEWAKGVGEFLKSPLDYIVNGFKSIVDSVVKLFEGLNLEKLSKMFKDTGIGLFFGALGKNMLSGELGAASLPGNLSKTLLALKDVFVSYSQSINAGSLFKIAQAIGILSLSIIGLGMAFQSNPQMLTDVVAAIALLGLVGAFLVRAMAMFQKFKKVQEIQEDVQKNVYNVSFVGADMVTAFMQPMHQFFTDLGTSLATSLGKKINANNTAIRFLALAGAVMMVIKTIKGVYDFLGTVNTDEARQRLAQATLFVGGAMLFVAILSTVTKMGDNKATIGGALSFITMAYAVKIMVGAIAEMSKWKKNEIIKGVAAGIGIAGMIAILAVALGQCQTEVVKINLKNGSNKYGKTSNPIFGMVAMMLGFAVAVRLLIPAFTAFAKLDLAGIGKFVVLLVGLGLLLTAMVKLTKNLSESENLLKGVGAMLALITMVTLLIIVFTIMGVLTKSKGLTQTIFAGLGMFAIGILAIAGAAWALEKLGATATLVKFAFAVSQFGLGIIAASVAVYIFAAAAPKIIEAITLVGEKLKDPETRAAFIIGLVALIGAILAVWLMTKGQLFQTVWTWIQSGLEAIKGIIKPLLDNVLDIVQKVFGWFHSNKILMAVGITAIVLLVLGILRSIIPDIVQGLFDILIVIILSLAKTIKTDAPRLLNALWILVKSILSALGGVLGKLVAKVDSWFGVGGGADPDEFGKEVADKILPDETIDKALDEINNKADKLEENAAKSFGDAKKNIQSGIDDGGGLNLTSFIGGATGGGAINSLIKPVSGIAGSIKTEAGGFDLTSVLGGGKENIFASADEAFSAIPDALKENFGVAGMNAEDGMAVIDNILQISGITTSGNVEDTAEETVANVNNTVETGAEQLVKTIDENGNELVTNVDGYFSDLSATEELAEQEQEESIKSHRDRMYNVWDPETQEKIRARNEKAALKAFLEPFKQILGPKAIIEMRKRANMMVAGFVDEFNSTGNQAKVWSAGSGLVKHLMSSVDRQALISSPSREAAWRGQMIVAGLVGGIMNNIGKAEMAGMTLATSTLNSVSDILNNETYSVPTITPVINSSGVQHSLGRIDGMFGKSALSTTLASDAFKGFSQNQMIKQEQIQNINSTNADVVAALGLLRGDVNNLNESFANTQVVLDSGALVGATARQMDNALGRISIYKGRGI